METKRCPGCNQPRLLSLFNYQARTSGRGLKDSGKCHICYREGDKENHYDNYHKDRISTLLKICKKADREKGRENDMDYAYMALCGSEYALKGCEWCKEKNPYLRWSPDRIDNDKGHLRTNVLPACEVCQHFHGCMPFPVFIDFVSTLQAAWHDGRMDGFIPPHRMLHKQEKARIKEISEEIDSAKLRIELPCQLCEHAAIGVFDFDAGSWQHPYEQRQVLCAKHSMYSIPRSKVVMVEDLTVDHAFTTLWARQTYEELLLAAEDGMLNSIEPRWSPRHRKPRKKQKS